MLVLLVNLPLRMAIEYLRTNFIARWCSEIFIKINPKQSSQGSTFLNKDGLLWVRIFFQNHLVMKFHISYDLLTPTKRGLSSARFLVRYNHQKTFTRVTSTNAVFFLFQISFRFIVVTWVYRDIKETNDGKIKAVK